jgi:DNA-binding NarL/FixJ family response regulator
VIDKHLGEHEFCETVDPPYMKKFLLSELSARENEILPLLANGLRYKDIAASLHVSTETIRTHVRNIYRKLEVKSRTEALNKVYGPRE